MVFSWTSRGRCRRQRPGASRRGQRIRGLRWRRTSYRTATWLQSDWDEDQNISKTLSKTRMKYIEIHGSSIFWGNESMIIHLCSNFFFWGVNTRVGFDPHPDPSYVMSGNSCHGMLQNKWPGRIGIAAVLTQYCSVLQICIVQAIVHISRSVCTVTTCYNVPMRSWGTGGKRNIAARGKEFEDVFHFTAQLCRWGNWLGIAEGSSS
jgi:hypothetical protein